MTGGAGERWLRRRTAGPLDAEMRLICFPYAGGSAEVFADWVRASDAELETVALELPGRAARFAEPAFTDLGSLVAELTAALVPQFDRPYALYGHSMGANIAHALAVELARLPDVEQPSALFVGARVAPGTAARSVGPDSTDADLVDWLRRLGGTPEQVLAEPDLLEVLLPTLRADLAVAAGRADGVLPVPIRAFAGRADAEAPTALMCGWSAVTTAAFALDELDGGHFFLADSGRAVLAAIRADLFGAADRPAPLADAR